MKLKKIASLVLAGVMAVSMLAGCAGKTGTTENNNTTVVAGSTTAVTVFNGEQEDIKFASNSALQNALSQAVKAVGTSEKYSQKILGSNNKPTTVTVYANEYVKEFITAATGIVDKGFTDKVGDSTKLIVERYDSNAALSEDAAVLTAAKALESVKENNAAAGIKTGDKYVAFTYDGTVAVASVTDTTGATVYFVAYTITQHGTEQTYTGVGE